MQRIGKQEGSAKRLIQVFLSEEAIRNLESMKAEGHSRSSSVAAIVDKYFKQQEGQ